MTFNTPDYVIDELQKKIGLPFINMVELIVKQIASNYTDVKVGLITSDGCLRDNFY